MKLSNITLCLLPLAIGPRAALACSPDQVSIIDFRPQISANGDGSGRAMRIVGSLDNFCTSSTDVEIDVSGIDAKGNSLGLYKHATIVNIPAGEKSFEIANVPYSPGVASYQLSVVATGNPSAAGSVPTLPGSTSTYSANPSANGSGAAKYGGYLAGSTYGYRRY